MLFGPISLASEAPMQAEMPRAQDRWPKGGCSKEEPLKNEGYTVLPSVCATVSIFPLNGKVWKARPSEGVVFPENDAACTRGARLKKV